MRENSEQKVTVDSQPLAEMHHLHEDFGQTAMKWTILVPHRALGSWKVQQTVQTYTYMYEVTVLKKTIKKSLRSAGLY